MKLFYCCLTAKIDIGKTDLGDSMISNVYFKGQCFDLGICLYHEKNNVKNAIILHIS